MRFLYITIVFVIISGCAKTSDSSLTNSGQADTLLLTDSLDFNILKYDTSYNVFPSKFLTTDLNEKEIIECEVLLKLFIIDYNVEATKRFGQVTNEHPGIQFNIKQFTIELKDYGRQYMAVISDKGTKLVYVNCFCDPSHFVHRDRIFVRAKDGGNCFFRFKLNLNEKRIYDFKENGDA